MSDRLVVRLDHRPSLIDADEADCMRSKVAEYTGDALDNIAERANNNDANALEALEQFEADLADCRAAG